MKDNQYKLILTSRGLNTEFGMRLMKEVFTKEHIDCAGKSIFLLTLPEYGVDEIIENNCIEFGFSKVYKAKDYENTEVDAMPEVDMIFVTEGNTFDIIKFFREHNFNEYVERIMKRDGVVYLGSSAGACLAAENIRIAELFDKNRGVTEYSGFGLLPEKDAIIPHYTYRELKTLRELFTEEERTKYPYVNFYNIADDEALLLEIQGDDKGKRITRKKRIRIEE